MSLIFLVIVLLMLCAAIAAVLLRSLLGGLAALSLVTLALAGLFALLRAPDVAIAEAVVGAGLTSVLLALTIRRTANNRKGEG